MFEGARQVHSAHHLALNPDRLKQDACENDDIHPLLPVKGRARRASEWPGHILGQATARASCPFMP